MSLTPLQRVAATAILVSAGVLALAGPGHAQQNSTAFPWNSGGGGGGQGGFSSPGAFFQPAAPAFYPPTAPAFYPPATAETSRAFYPSMDTSDRVRINVTAPANAKITFDGSGTTQTGTFRRYVSPAISPGRYTYDIQAVWTENGREVRQNRSIPVQPGAVVQVTITRNGVTARTEP